MIRQIVKAALPSAVRLKLRLAHTKIRPLFYAGSRVECSCCGACYRQFLPEGRRSNIICPRCLALERQRLCILYLKNRTTFFTDHLRLLHFAPEPCLRRIFSARSNIQYFTVDYRAVADVRMDITALAVRDHAFDAILCMHVLEHIPDDRCAMSELFRILKPGGWAILQVPLEMGRKSTYEDWSITDPEDRLQHFGQEDHVRKYGRDYKMRLEGAGFQVTVDDYVRSFSTEQIYRYGLSADEDIYMCRKPR